MSQSMKPDGGQAFPVSSGEGDYTVPGMTLRDWFAGMALPVIMQRWTSVTWDEQVKEAASMAYEMADALLAEREK